MQGTDGTAYSREVRRLARDLPRLRTAEAGARIGALRRAALAEGLPAAAALAENFGAALRSDRRATPLAAWFDALDHAAALRDAVAVPVLLATIGVRFAS